MKRRTLRIVGQAMLSLVLSLAGTISRSAAGQKNWSVDLSLYDLRAGAANASRHHKPTILVAATNGGVAVAWGKPARPLELGEPDNWLSEPGDVRLQLFEANDAKLKAKSG